MLKSSYYFILSLLCCNPIYRLDNYNLAYFFIMKILNDLKQNPRNNDQAILAKPYYTSSCFTLDLTQRADNLQDASRLAYFERFLYWSKQALNTINYKRRLYTRQLSSTSCLKINHVCPILSRRPVGNCNYTNNYTLTKFPSLDWFNKDRTKRRLSLSKTRDYFSMHAAGLLSIDNYMSTISEDTKRPE